MATTHLLAMAILGALLIPGDADPTTACLASSQGSECVGCSRDYSAPVSNGCIDVDVSGTFILDYGNCTGMSAPCIATPCSWTGDATILITNNCEENLFIRRRVNGVVQSETEEVTPSGQYKVTFDQGGPVECGTTVETHLWFGYPPPPGVFTGGQVTWSYSCSGCGLIHGG